MIEALEGGTVVSKLDSRRNILQGQPTSESSGQALTGELVHCPEAERREEDARGRVLHAQPCSPTPRAYLLEPSISMPSLLSSAGRVS